MELIVFINIFYNIKLPFFIKKKINIYPRTIEINSNGKFKSTNIKYNYNKYEFINNICVIRFLNFNDFQKAINIVNKDCYMLSNNI
tara:strand:- start:370 stop:627 length:258 start_codon:yes stop_codon:yes gene_type:complete